MALSVFKRKAENGDSAPDARAAYRAALDKASAHNAETAAVQDRIDSALTARDVAKKRSDDLERSSVDVLASPDLPAGRAVSAKIEEIAAEIRHFDRTVDALSRRLADLDRMSETGGFQREAAAARQILFGVIRDREIAKIQPEVLDAIARAQLASAQAGDGLNFGPFCEQHLRTYRSRSTDHDYDARITFADELIEGLA